jgi:hypothetical protein
MSWVAASGCDTNETCEAGTSTIVAFARSAMNRWSAGGIALSSVPSKYQHGSVFHAGGRPSVLTGHKLQLAQEMYASGQDTVAAIAKTLGVSRASIYRHLTRAGG